ncbi:hypothetical protein GP954_41165, partial [Escherichia coli]|nr:hypothetical protein [Escherichia coli]
ARALIARGWGVSLVSRCLRVSRAQLHVILRRTDDWKDGRRSRINASGRMLINGSVLSKGGLINLDMHPGSVWTGSSLSDNVN